MLVDGRVQYAARFFIGLVTRQQEITAQAVSKLLYRSALQGYLRAIAGNSVDIRVDTHRLTQDRGQALAGWQ